MRIMLDIPLSLHSAIEVMTGAVPYYADATLYAVCTDSRECEDGDLFFSLARNRDERIKHANNAVRRGAYAVCDSGDFIEVENTELALLRLAAYYKSKLHRLIKTVGITGSVGKSTVTRYTAEMLSLSYIVASTIGNFNNRIGISLSILSARADTEVLVLEMGMNHAGEIAQMSSVIRPEICVITCIGSAHIGNLGSREAIRDAKCEIITDDTEAVICPFDEPLLKTVPHGLTFSLENADADAVLTESAGIFTLKTLDMEIDGIELAVIGKHNRYNSLIAAVVCILLGFSGDGVRQAVGRLGNGVSHGRIFTVGGIAVIDDTYNSSPEAAYAMLDLLKDFPSPHIAVLGDMLELGDAAGDLHRELGRRAASVDRLYAIGEYSTAIFQGAIDGGMSADAVSVMRDMDVSVLTEILLRQTVCGTVFIKGSHATGLSLLAKSIRERIEG